MLYLVEILKKNNCVQVYARIQKHAYKLTFEICVLQKSTNWPFISIILLYFLLLLMYYHYHRRHHISSIEALEILPGCIDVSCIHFLLRVKVLCLS